MGIGKSHSFAGETIKIGGAELGVGVERAGVPVSLVVRVDHNDIGGAGIQRKVPRKEQAGQADKFREGGSIHGLRESQTYLAFRARVLDQQSEVWSRGGRGLIVEAFVIDLFRRTIRTSVCVVST